MRPDRWQEIERIYHAALERDPELRAEFLADASGGDEELLEEVQSLLEQPGSDSRLDRPVWEPRGESPHTGVIAGTQLGPYEIEALLGSGGMGEVFRARDTRLNRTVAIKISKGPFTRRFKREARAVAALNHQNIVQVYELESENGDDFIVMEFVPGRTLAELLCDLRLSVDQALEYANQIAAALAAAHAAGIVHRDIKPANIIVSDAGVVKVLDFGLAKVEQRVVRDTPLNTETQTASGTIMGTAAYMSPEQARGKAVDARSDIFSTGALFYEMLAGSRAFDGESTLEVLSKVFRETPKRIRSLRPEVPQVVERIVERCLEKDPALRYASGKELAKELALCRRPPRTAISRRTGMLIAATLIATMALSGWLYSRNRRERWVRNDALPKIQALLLKGDYPAAFDLTRTALRYFPDHPQLMLQWAEVSLPVDMTSTPPGAKVLYRPYGDAGGPWRLAGITPLENISFPQAYMHLRVEKEGAEPAEFATIPFFLRGQTIPLHPAGQVPSGMVPVPAQAGWAGASEVVPLPDYLLDRFEVTNRQFQQFLDAGGYRDLKYWQHPFHKSGGMMAREAAMALFRDSTGRPGPAGWELGTFPKDTADFPVSGVSWFEANAYCAYRGKALPTVQHWRKAAGFGIYSDILLFSNFANAGPARVGAHTGISAFGAYDMAGNVKEWCQNSSGELRAILGGGWNEPAYAYQDADAQDPFSRAATYGLRCASYPSAPPPATLAPMEPPLRDYAKEKPVNDDTFEIFRRLYTYDKAELDTKIESVDESNDYWRKETVSYRAAYGGERIPAYLFLPKNAKPPYQTVLWVPGLYAWQLRHETGNMMQYFSFLLRTGRAVLYPVYQGTFERRKPEHSAGSNAFRDLMIQIAKDVSRSVDFLESRSDIQSDRVAYYGISAGGTYGPLLLAMEPRLKTGILLAGGLFWSKVPAEIDILNFAPRVRVPVLMLNGLYDFAMPSETFQKPMFRLLGTPAQDKRHKQFDTGHLVVLQDVIPEVLNWLDRYLGPVETNH